MKDIWGIIKEKRSFHLLRFFWGKISLKSKNQLTETFCARQKNVKFNVVFRSSNRIRNAFCSKIQIPKYMNLNVTYTFQWNICNYVYIGETKCHFLVNE